MAGAVYAAVYFMLSIATVIAAGVLQYKERDNRMSQKTVALVSVLSVDGIIDGMAQNLYDVTPQQVVDRMLGARRRNRRPKQLDAERPPVPILGEKPPLAPLLGLTAACIVLPLAAAATKIRAVEVVRG
jgi:hypothetical protein